MHRQVAIAGQSCDARSAMRARRCPEARRTSAPWMAGQGYDEVDETAHERSKPARTSSRLLMPREDQVQAAIAHALGLPPWPHPAFDLGVAARGGSLSLYLVRRGGQRGPLAIEGTGLAWWLGPMLGAQRRRSSVRNGTHFLP